MPDTTTAVDATGATGTPIDTSGTTGVATTAIDPSQSTLSPNFSQYVYNMLGMGEGLASLPYQEYTGQRYAGPSALQQQSFQGLSNLGLPSQYGTATNLLSQAGYNAGASGYGPSTFGNFFQSPQAYQPAQYSSGFNYQPGQSQTFGTQYQAPQTYQAGTFMPGFNYTPQTISSGLGPVGSVADYMNQYTSAVTDPEVREAQRQADIASATRGAKFAQAGAFGGARQAIESAEAQRNLATQQGDIRAKGLQAAYDRAMQQRAQEAQLGLTAQQATEQARQFGAQQGAQFGLTAQQAQEASRQFGAQQAAQAAQLAAQYGLSAQQAQEAARQFNAQQGLTAEQLQTQFGLDAQKATELSRQFGAQQAAQSAQLAAQYGLSGAQQTEASRQYAAQYGLNALQQQLAAGQALGSLGTQQFGSQLQGLQAILNAGGTQQQLQQQPLDFAYQQFQESMKYPYQQATYMQSLLQGLPLQAAQYTPEESALGSLFSGGLSGLALAKMLGGG